MHKKIEVKPKFKCRCDNPDCAKCLGLNCIDDDCKIHTKERKKAFRLKWETIHGEPFPENNKKDVKIRS